MNVKQGFTLIEIIIFLVMASIFGTMLTTYMQTTVTSIHKPIDNLNHAITLQDSMATITNSYYSLCTSEKPEDVLQNLKSTVETDLKYSSYSPTAQYLDDLAGTTSEKATDILKITISSPTSGSLTSYFTKP